MVEIILYLEQRTYFSDCPMCPGQLKFMDASLICSMSENLTTDASVVRLCVKCCSLKSVMLLCIKFPFAFEEEECAEVEGGNSRGRL